MTRRTKKVGIAGRYGVRYGVKIRKRLKDVGEQTSARHQCPECHHMSVRRKGTGIWHCRRCGVTFAGGAYRPVVTGGFRKAVVVRPEEEWEELEEEEPPPDEEKVDAVEEEE
jgi:large subunit ribosomal protein L37Ae